MAKMRRETSYREGELRSFSAMAGGYQTMPQYSVGRNNAEVQYGLVLAEKAGGAVVLFKMTNVHPVFMLFGLIIIGGEAIISYKSLPFRKEVKKVIHLALNGVALVLGIVGISAAFKNHNESGIANLYSLHSWIGIGVIVLYGIQWLYGFVAFFYPGGSADLRRATLPWHALLGACVYVLAAANSALGFLEKLTFLQSSGVAKYGTEALLVNFTAITTVVFAVFVILSVISQPSSDQHHDDYRIHSAK
ncbi:Transmembrane ascorbate ferrireductase 1, partial [Cucurbita argyrosperma subsp. sororia]